MTGRLKKARPGRPRQPGVRQRLLDAGLRTMYRAGYTGTGLSDVVAAAGVPKGSFYNHFENKESFAATVADRFADWNDARLVAALSHRDIPPLDRLRAYFAERRRALADYGYQGGCLLANLGVEATETVPLLRDRLVARFAEWQARIAGCLRDAQERGELPNDFEPEALAGFAINSWEGALLRMKLERSAAPLLAFEHFFFDTLLARSSS